jgi:hypothetical protein
MSNEQLQYCENHFSEDSEIVEQMNTFEYSGMSKEQKIIFWQIIVKDHLLKTYKYIVPGTEPKVVTVESIREEQERRKKQQEDYERNLVLAVQQLESINIRRIYMMSSHTNTTSCSVLNWLPLVKLRCKFPVVSGNLVEVKYEILFANYKAVEFSESTVGLYTSGMADCIGVMFFIGQQYSGRGFWGGSLAHLPGGSTKGINWNNMVFGLSATQLRGYIQSDPLYAQALICVRPDRLAGSSDVYNLIKNSIMTLGFGPPQIMVYIGDIPGFAIHKNGCFGVLE